MSNITRAFHKVLIIVCLTASFPFDVAVAVTLNPGDLLVTNSNPPAIIKIEPLTGEQTIVSSGTNLYSPRDIVIASNGDVFVTDNGCWPSPWDEQCTEQVSPAIIKVDPDTGKQTIVSQGDLFCEPWGIKIDLNGDLLVKDACAFSDFRGGVIRVDPLTGLQKEVSSGGSLNGGRGITIEPQSRDIFVSTGTDNINVPAIMRIDPTTGNQKDVFPGCCQYWGLTTAADGNILIADAGYNYDPTTSSKGAILQFNPTTGSQTVVSMNGLFWDPVAVATASNGDIFVADSGKSWVIKVEPANNGLQAVVTSGNFLNAPFGIAVIPVTSPAIKVSLTSYDFGNVVWRQTSTAIFTIANIGGGELTLTGTHIEGAQGVFSISSLPETNLSAGKSTTIGVSFTPAVAQSYEGVLLIESNDATESISLNGRGVLADTPSEQVAATIDYIEDSLVSGELSGVGSGNSADKKVNALINMIDAAGDLLESGLMSEGCLQLADLYGKVDGLSPPPDFVEGSAANGLASIIKEMRTTYGCQ